MKLAEVCVKRPVFATMLILCSWFWDLFLYATRRRSISENRSADGNRPDDLPGASPEEIESQITKPIEEVINTISGIDELRSTTLEGVSLVVVQFVLDKNSDVAAQEVRDKVATVIGSCRGIQIRPLSSAWTSMRRRFFRFRFMVTVRSGK